MHLVMIYFIGLIFGAGISVSGMANPAKVLNFFDIVGDWDPSLIFVMGGALVTTFIGYRLVFRRNSSLSGQQFHLPTSRAIDLRLIGGATLFGVGWGIAGFCPGGALPALGTGRWQVILFVASVIAGIFLARRLQSLAAGTPDAAA